MEHTNSRGQVFQLYRTEAKLNGGGTTDFYFFAMGNSVRGVPVAELPIGRVVAEGRNGLPFLRRAETLVLR